MLQRMNILVDEGDKMEKKYYVKPEIKKVEIKATNALASSYMTPLVPGTRNVPIPKTGFEPYYDPYVDPSQE